MDPSLESQFWYEYHNAQASEASGMEGRARVCARRAASILLRDHLQRKNELSLGMNSLDIIKYVQESSAPSDLSTLLSHFTEKVNEGYQLPSKTDLVASLFQLAQMLDIALDLKDLK